MTPTLPGRWQTRLLLVGGLGSLVTLPFFAARGDPAYFQVLAGVIVFGLAWDVLYARIQARRWDHDWPVPFQLAAGLIEGAALYAVLDRAGLPAGAVTAHAFAAHYATVWTAGFIVAQGPIRVLLPRWRFRGAEVVSRAAGRWAVGAVAVGLTLLFVAAAARERRDAPGDQAVILECQGQPVTIAGTRDADTLTGTAGRDVIEGLAGDDLIAGLDGNDSPVRRRRRRQRRRR